MAKIKMTMQAGFTVASFVSTSGGKLDQLTYSTRIKLLHSRLLRACPSEGVLTSFEARTKGRGGSLGGGAAVETLYRITSSAADPSPALEEATNEA